MKNKLLAFADEVPELEKRVFGLEILSEIDVRSLSSRELDNWYGLLFDTVSLLQQSVSDMRTLARLISEL